MSNHISDAESTSPRTIVIQQSAPRRRWVTWLLMTCLSLSVMFNLIQLVAFSDYTSGASAPHQRFRDGELTSSNKIARVELGFTIMPPHTARLIKTLDTIRQDDSIGGVLLIVDSPGGMVSDSHQIYHKLKQVSEKKPVYVAMKGIAASGGYYVAMGAGPEGKIFAEPTTWTGSIGVIIPRYDVSQLASDVGVKSDPLKTGEFKDTLNPLRELSIEERAMWEEVLEDSFSRFIQVIDEGRANLSEQEIRKLATGQIYTAQQALDNGLVDAIAYEDVALKELKVKLGYDDARVIEFYYPPTVSEILLGGAAQGRAAAVDPLTTILNSNVPRAMYLFGWHPGVSTSSW